MLSLKLAKKQIKLAEKNKRSNQDAKADLKFFVYNVFKNKINIL